MKYVCLGYLRSDDWQEVPEGEQVAMMDACFRYDEVLMESGNYVQGIALQGAESATTLRLQAGKVSVLDGPYAETKEQLGGIMILEADNLDHAVQLISKHPGLQVGSWEIRPAADLSEMMAQSVARREGRS